MLQIFADGSREQWSALYGGAQWVIRQKTAAATRDAKQFIYDDTH